MDRSARDIPELGKIWFGGGRGFLVGALSHYLTDRIRTRRLRPELDVGIAARFIVETCAFWAVHRHWDAARQDLAEDRVRAIAGFNGLTFGFASTVLGACLAYAAGIRAARKG